MMSSASIICMAVSGILCLVFPIAILLYFKKKEDLNLKPFFIGMIIFIVFVLILEQLLHLLVTGCKLIENPIAFAIYGALAAGVFEEVGRFAAFKTVLKNNHEWKDGLAYGIGHGGVEAMLISAVPNIICVISTCLGNNILTQEQVDPLLIFVGSAERIFAFGIQVGLTMVVLYAIRYRKNIFLLFAILLHALVDFPAALYQKQIIGSIYAVEGFVIVCFVISIIFLVKSKKIFSKEEVKLIG